MLSQAATVLQSQGVGVFRLSHFSFIITIQQNAITRARDAEIDTSVLGKESIRHN